jgi:phospholipase C
MHGGAYVEKSGANSYSLRNGRYSRCVQRRRDFEFRGARGLLPDSGSGSGSPIQHIVLIIQENRTFNNLFATFPGATGNDRGERAASTAAVKSINLEETGLR